MYENNTNPKSIKDIDFAGVQIDFWTVISMTCKENKESVFWLCRCICGQEKEISSWRLFHKKTSSCGCKKAKRLRYIDSFRINKKEKPDLKQKAIDEKFNSYVLSAYNKKRDFTLTKDLFTVLIFGNCHYCNIRPNRPYKRGKVFCHDVLFNGIDRKNNSEGYTLENSVTCCTECNFLKGHKNYDDFIKIINKISSNLRRKEKKIRKELKNEKKSQL